MKVFARVSGLLALATVILAGATPSPAATPAGGTINSTMTSASWIGQTYAVSAVADPTECPPLADPFNLICDHYYLTVSDLGGANHYSWVFSAYMLGATVTVPVYGRLSDIYGRRRFFVLAAEDEEASKLAGDSGDVLVRFLSGERPQRLFEPRDRLGRMSLAEVDLGETRGYTGSRVAEFGSLERRQRLLEQGARLLGPGSPPGHLARAVVEIRAHE